MDRANRANRALTDPNLFKRKEVRLARGVSDLMLWPYTSMVSDLVVLSPASRPCTRLVKFLKFFEAINQFGIACCHF